MNGEPEAVSGCEGDGVVGHVEVDSREDGPGLLGRCGYGGLSDGCFERG